MPKNNSPLELLPPPPKLDNGPTADWLGDYKSAQEQARRVEDFWHIAGYPSVAVEVIDLAPDAISKRVFGLKSNIVNGIPSTRTFHVEAVE